MGRHSLRSRTHPTVRSRTVNSIPCPQTPAIFGWGIVLFDQTSEDSGLGVSLFGCCFEMHLSINPRTGFRLWFSPEITRRFIAIFPLGSPSPEKSFTIFEETTGRDS